MTLTMASNYHYHVYYSKTLTIAANIHYHRDHQDHVDHYLGLHRHDHRDVFIFKKCIEIMAIISFLIFVLLSRKATNLLDYQITGYLEIGGCEAVGLSRIILISHLKK